MPRITKCRRVCTEPTHTVFQPQDEECEKVILQVEELESLRLTDFEGLDQDGAAKRMQVSRGTFQRILYAARHKVAEALVTGKTIIIQGGNYKVSDQRCGTNKICRYCQFSINGSEDAQSE